MPVLSLIALSLLRGSGGKDHLVVYVGELSLGFRVLVRLRIVSRVGLLKMLGWLSRCEVRSLPSGANQSGFAELHLDVSEAIVRITAALEEELRRDAGVGWLAGLLGNEPAMAYTMQNIGHLGLAHHLLSVVPCRVPHPGERILLVAPPLWPGSLLDLIRQNVVATDSFAWPRAIVGLLQETGALTARLAVGTKLLSLVFRRGRPAGVSQRHFRVATEFVDMARLNGGPHDADYLVDGQKLASQDMLFFVTGAEEARLRRQGVGRDEVERLIHDKGYTLIWLRALRLDRGLLRRLLRHWFAAGQEAFRSPWREVLRQGICQYTDWSVLFAHSRFSVVLYPKFPNGNTRWRTDTAIVTGLARRHGVLSAGLQNRTVYAHKYEASFDCYDRMWLWGPGWYEGFGPAKKYFGELKAVGCIYLDAFPGPALRSGQQPSGPVRVVAIFTGDLSSGGHYSLDDNVAFLVVCLELATAHPDIAFKVKGKDADHADVFAAQSSLVPLHAKAPNFAYLRQARHSYRELLAEADVVLTIGFTTPGTEALLLGKRAFYYSTLNRGGEAYRFNPLWVARNPAELKASFALAVAAAGETEAALRQGLDKLDPFRDGCARQRILEDMETLRVHS